MLLSDATDEQQQPHLARLVEFFQTLDLLPTSDWADRLDRYESLLQKFTEAAAARVRTHPGLRD